MSGDADETLEQEGQKQTANLWHHFEIAFFIT